MKWFKKNVRYRSVMDYEGSNFLEVYPYTHINGKPQAHYKSSHWSMRTYAYEAQKITPMKI